MNSSARWIITALALNLILVGASLAYRTGAIANPPETLPPSKGDPASPTVDPQLDKSSKDSPGTLDVQVDTRDAAPIPTAPARAIPEIPSLAPLNQIPSAPLDPQISRMVTEELAKYGKADLGETINGFDPAKPLALTNPLTADQTRQRVDRLNANAVSIQALCKALVAISNEVAQLEEFGYPEEAEELLRTTEPIKAVIRQLAK